MIWLLNDFDLFSVLLRAVALSCEAMVSGGVLFLLLVALPAEAESDVLRVCFRALRWVAGAMALAACATLVLETALLVGNAQLTVWRALTAGPLLTEGCAAGFATLITILSGPALSSPALDRRAGLRKLLLCLCAAGLLGSSVALSHAVSRLEHRVILVCLTALHHLGTAAWIGAMPYLLAALKRTSDADAARRMVMRFSWMAIGAVAALAGAGVGLSWYYIGTPSGLYGTAYGVMVMVKGCLLLLMLLLGAANWYVHREVHRSPARLLTRLRSFAEAEVGLGFTAILAAAALTSQPPAVDAMQDRLTMPQIEARMRWETPRLKSPPLAALAPATPIEEAVRMAPFQASAASDANDMAWSEYNHHWAGIVVLAAGLLALASRFRGMRWARFWPVSFAGLAVFLLLRADPENWPLGPRPFWKSFFAPDVLEHRAAAALILGFAAFECAVQAGRLRAAWARYAFPLMCAAGAALLLTHNHALANDQEALLAEMNHSVLALLGAVAGWARWLELRLPPEDRERSVAGFIWPVALMMVGLVLLDYREM